MTTQTLGLTFQYSHTIGRNENSGTGWTRAVAMVRGHGDLLYVVSRSHEAVASAKRVTICTIDEEYIGQFGQGVVVGETPDPEADGSINWPTALAIDGDENVYLADEGLNRISVFSKDGEWLGKWGTLGDGDGEFNRPSGLAFDQEENLFLVDSLNNRVQKFTKEGKFLARWGKAGTADGEFDMPWGIDIDKDGYVYVADWRNDRIQKFTPEGEFLMQIGISGTGGKMAYGEFDPPTVGTGDGELLRPSSVAVDQDGIVYVADWGNNRLQVFDADGTFVTKITGNATISKWGKDKLDANSEMWKEREEAQDLGREKSFWGPICVDVDVENRVFILESTRGRVQVYRKILPYFTGVRL